MSDAIEFSSPLGNVVAQVEDDDRAVYFYLGFQSPGSDSLDLRACWVRNRIAAPGELSDEDVERGVPTLMPANSCRHPQGAPPLCSDDLTVTWFEEGNGAALLEGTEVLAIIPPWSGMSGFNGYARDCIAETPLAWPLQHDNVLLERISAAEAYWQEWDDPDYWDAFSAPRIAALEQQLGPHSKYFAIDGEEWPPKALLRFDREDSFILVTMGLSLLPQPNVEMFVEDPRSCRRIELAAAFDRRCPEDQVARFGSYVSGQSGYPWAHQTWFGDGHTAPCDSIPAFCGGNRFPAVLMTSRMPEVSSIQIPAFRGDPIKLLWLVPITEQERAYAASHSSDDLLRRLRSAGVSAVARTRSGVL
jgi:hypothetical protein